MNHPTVTPTELAHRATLIEQWRAKATQMREDADNNTLCANARGDAEQAYEAYRVAAFAATHHGALAQKHLRDRVSQAEEGSHFALITTVCADVLQSADARAGISGWRV